MRIRSFSGTDTENLDREINEFVNGNGQHGETLKVRDIKITAVVQPGAGFFDNRGFGTETVYTYVVMYD